LAGGQYYYVQAAKIDTGTTVIPDPDYASYWLDGESAGFIFDTNYPRGIPLIF
jgi:hypothetical protein